jgi:hypothetical protein
MQENSKTDEKTTAAKLLTFIESFIGEHGLQAPVTAR